MHSALTILTGQAPVSPHHLATGRYGESVAASYLRGIGYTVQDRNVQLGHDEIDVIARDPEDDVLVFAEVKTRTRSNQEFSPEAQAGWRKRLRLQRSARKWVARHQYDGGYRVDLVCVDGGSVVRHVKELAWR